MSSPLSYRAPCFASDHDALRNSQHIAIVAHQDDAEIIAYSAISKCFNREDLWFSSITLTNGSGASRGGKYTDISDDLLSQHRQYEQIAAAHIGRYALAKQWPNGSHFIKEATHQATDQLYALLVESYQEGETKYLYTHNPFDKHATHRAVVEAVIKACRQVKIDYPEFDLKLLGVEVWGALDWLPECYKTELDCSAMPHLEQALIGLYDSQIDGNKGYDKAVMGRRLANATFSDSHDLDQKRAVQYALDLTCLITSSDKYPDIKHFVQAILKAHEAIHLSHW